MNQHGLDETNLLAILLIILIIIIFLAWMVRYKVKAKERLLIIEKDYDLKKFSEKNNTPFAWVKIGIIFTSGCIGFLIGSLIEFFTRNISTSDTSEIAQSAINSPIKLFGDGTLTLLLMYLFAGIAMIFSKKISKDEK